MHKKGDIFVAVWGYKQVNVDFFQVTDSYSNGYVLIRPIKSEIVSTNHKEGTVIPKKDCFDERHWLLDETSRLTRYKVYRDGHIRVHECIEACEWDGKPVRWTAGD